MFDSRKKTNVLFLPWVLQCSYPPWLWNIWSRIMFPSLNFPVSVQYMYIFKVFNRKLGLYSNHQPQKFIKNIISTVTEFQLKINNCEKKYLLLICLWWSVKRCCPKILFYLFWMLLALVLSTCSSLLSFSSCLATDHPLLSAAQSRPLRSPLPPRSISPSLLH
jgi:hypothetical protein